MSKLDHVFITFFPWRSHKILLFHVIHVNSARITYANQQSWNPWLFSSQLYFYLTFLTCMP